jgi:hypothetical protein
MANPRRSARRLFGTTTLLTVAPRMLLPETTHLLLPYLFASQAQKRVTINEALRLLDGLVKGLTGT